MEIADYKEKIKLQFDIIKRTDSYISTTNNKAALLLAANAASITIIANKIDCFFFLFNKNMLYTLAFSLSILIISSLVFLSIINSLRSILPTMHIPFSKKKELITNTNQSSNISFVYIAKITNPELYFQNYKDVNENTLLKDMCTQSLELSIIAQYKFSLFISAVNNLKNAYFIIFLMVLLKTIDYINGVL